MRRLGASADWSREFGCLTKDWGETPHVEGVIRVIVSTSVVTSGVWKKCVGVLLGYLHETLLN